VAMVSLWPGPVKTEFMVENVIKSEGDFYHSFINRAPLSTRVRNQSRV
jgi:hypothetical protein